MLLLLLLLSLVVIKLEGGADSDLAVLDCPPTPPPERRRSSSNQALMSPRGDDITDLSAEEKKERTMDLSTEPAALQTDKDSKNYGNYIVVNILYNYAFHSHSLLRKSAQDNYTFCNVAFGQNDVQLNLTILLSREKRNNV